MPIYEYNCPMCGSFDVIQGVNDKPVKANPDCTNKKCPCKAERVMSASAFHLKGGGWYKDGYSVGTAGAKGDSASPSPTSGAEAGGGGDSGAAGGETKGKESSSNKSSSLKSRADGGAKKAGGGCGSGCKCH